MVYPRVHLTTSPLYLYNRTPNKHKQSHSRPSPTSILLRTYVFWKFVSVSHFHLIQSLNFCPFTYGSYPDGRSCACIYTGHGHICPLAQSTSSSSSNLYRCQATWFYNGVKCQPTKKEKKKTFFSINPILYGFHESNDNISKAFPC